MFDSGGFDGIKRIEFDAFNSMCLHGVGCFKLGQMHHFKMVEFDQIRKKNFLIPAKLQGLGFKGNESVRFSQFSNSIEFDRIRSNLVEKHQIRIPNLFQF